MTFEEILNQALAMLQRQGQVSYRALKRQFDLDDAYIEDLRFEIIEVHRAAYEGTINQFLGDGFMALFGAPLAHEDHARRAVLAALALQRLLQDHQAELGEPYGVTCAFRLGLNTGLVVVGSIGNNLRMDYSSLQPTTPRHRPASTTPSTWRVPSRPSRSSCASLLASLASGNSKARE